MNIDIAPQTYKEIEGMISSENSVVGIDAKKTHIFILHLLLQIDKRLERVEKALELQSNNPTA
jgi:hypothetical protein